MGGDASAIVVLTSEPCRIFRHFGLPFSRSSSSRAASPLAVGSLYALAIWLMSLSVRHLEVGLAYAVWAGGGTALTAVVGMLWFGESFHSTRLIGLAFVVAGVICLNLDWR